MIIEHNGKKLAFGLNWRSRVSEGDVHGDARAAKSKYFWYADNAVYFGTLPEGENKKGLRSPLYAGAVALLHRYPDVPNLAMVLQIPESNPDYPDGAYIVCCVHQSRPHSGYDKVIASKEEVTETLIAFKTLCGSSGFEFYGDVQLSGITAATFDDLHSGADQTALMRKTKSAIINPLVACLSLAIVISAGAFGYNAYSNFKKAEAQRIALATQKNAQQRYDEELAARRLDATVLAKDMDKVLKPLRQMAFSLGGWPLRKSTCNLTSDRNMVCLFEYVRPERSKATYETFLAAAATQFDNVEFAGRVIKASKTHKAIPFTDLGTVIDAAKPQRGEIIEFVSILQRLERQGKHKRDEFEPIALPPGVTTGELTSPPVTAANWEFVSPLRNMKELTAFPGYATISQLTVTHTDQPAYEHDLSLVMVTATGKIFSKN